MDHLRFCEAGQHFVHLSRMVERGLCGDCEEAIKRHESLLWTPDKAYAEAEQKIWAEAKRTGKKIERLIN